MLVPDGLMPAVMLVTVKVVLGPAAAALFPTASTAELAVILIPSVPLPEILLSVTVRVDVPAPVTLTVALAFPVVFKVMLLFANDMLLASV